MAKYVFWGAVIHSIPGHGACAPVCQENCNLAKWHMVPCSLTLSNYESDPRYSSCTCKQKGVKLRASLSQNCAIYISLSFMYFHSSSIVSIFFHVVCPCFSCGFEFFFTFSFANFCRFCLFSPFLLLVLCLSFLFHLRSY